MKRRVILALGIFTKIEPTDLNINRFYFYEHPHLTEIQEIKPVTLPLQPQKDGK
jgi:hypothetical protein